MKLPVVLAVLVGIFALACSSAAPAPAESTSKINATVEARLSEDRSEEHTSELQSRTNLLCRPLLEKKNCY